MIALLTALSLAAQERCHIVADRSHYSAGETVFCSVTALLDTGGISDASGVCYAGLYSAEGLAASAKFELIGGRGGGEISLPASLPTGNYLLVAWTGAGKTSDVVPVISVYNPSTTARTGDVVVESDYTPLRGNGPASTSYVPPDPVTVSVSLVRDNGFPSYSAPGPLRVETPSKAEPDGETVAFRLTGDRDYCGMQAFIAVPGTTQLYVATVPADGMISFDTGNIPGHKDIAFVIGKDDDVGSYAVELISPFPSAISAQAPALRISPSMGSIIPTLGNGRPDTLSIGFPARKRGTLYFASDTQFSYILDDYTRFPTMKETLTEFVTDIRPRLRDDKVELQVRFRENVNDYFKFDRGRSMTLLDGVPIFRQKLIYEYDPALVERIDVYRNIFFMGTNFFQGIADFVTFKKNLPGFTFGGDIKILEFDGVSPVRAYAGGHQTLYWNPIVELDAGQSLDIALPEGASGDFILTIEGFTKSGKPVREVYHLSK